MIYHKHSACVQETRLKNLGELFFRHIYRNGRKYIPISILFYIFAKTSFFGGFMERTARNASTRRSPSVPLHLH